MDTKRINVTFDLESYNQIRAIAHRENISMSEQLRLWSMDALNGQVNKDNIDLITQIIRNELKVILHPSVERLASLSAKTCVQASTAAYLNAEAINKLVPVELQQDVREAYEMARKKAVIYTKNKGEDNI